MCGIFGWMVKRASCKSKDQLVKLTDMMAHRGPDASGYELKYTRDNKYSVGFGHRRLSIIDLSNFGSQPMWNADKTCCIIFNGEIYNYLELKVELEALGEKFSTTSDTEVLLTAVKCWGKNAIPRFRGMFSFAIYDTVLETVTIARDHFGKKPLFINIQDEDIYFASEINSILNIPGFKRSFNWLALDEYLLDRYVPGPKTFFEGVTKLDPGSILIWKAGKYTIERYYTPPIASATPDITNYNEAVKIFYNSFDDAVRIRMRSDAPFGAFLSGGIDSSAVVATMMRHSNKPIRTFSVGFEEQEYSELNFCKIAANTFGTDHLDMQVTSQSFFDHWNEAILHRGAPVSEASDIPMLMLSHAAKSSVKMVLTGEGADEIFAGYPKHMAELYSFYYQALIPSKLHDNVILPLVNLLPYGMRRIKVLAKAMGQRNSADRFRIWFGGLSKDERDQLLGYKGAQTTMDDFPFSINTGSNLRRSQFFDQTSWLPDNSLERADRMMMAGSIEGRMPFMDTELAMVAARMPDNFLIRKGRSKAVLRSAMQGIVPNEILNRPKNGFRVPINEWFRGAQSGIMRDLLTSDASQVRTILNTSFIDQIVDEHIGGRVNHERILWSLCNLEQFIRVYKPDLETEVRGRVI
jgi:asparagine synthase (glutamine-hydrolysing)